jgi:hypothetical protein
MLDGGYGSAGKGGQTGKNTLISHTCWPLDRLHVFAYHMYMATQSSSNLRMHRQTQRTLKSGAAFLTSVCLTRWSAAFLKNIIACFRRETSLLLCKNSTREVSEKELTCEPAACTIACSHDC